MKSGFCDEQKVSVAVCCRSTMVRPSCLGESRRKLSHELSRKLFPLRGDSWEGSIADPKYRRSDEVFHAFRPLLVKTYKGVPVDRRTACSRYVDNSGAGEECRWRE
jgi:hypothetical protein